MIRVLIADDHPFLSEGVKAVLTAAGMQVVAMVTGGEEALSAIDRHQPDVVILDLKMPKGDGLATLQEMRRRGDQRPVVMLTAYTSDPRLIAAARAGVNAIVSKQNGSTKLADIVAIAAQGGLCIPPEIAAQAQELGDVSGDLAARLSLRERDIVLAVAKGLRNREVAEQFGISEGAVKVALFRVYGKLGVHSRPELLLRLREIGLQPD